MANTVRRTSEPVRDSHLWARLLWALDTTTQEVLGAVRSYNQNLWIDPPFEGAAYLPR